MYSTQIWIYFLTKSVLE
uniref:Uncharacterized protein n=1 Tax=Anguilla anguilla TaxID=7936 RepID=A0A0E9Y1H1_ANGAN